ncbi:alpha/beta-hydrolase [Pseudovirgaria hyperparasitica]|uniref:Alpha/beta-hydrolase n=1 Tax=Pseudovirgaria hyperparasitica TaxID=470096 RepID=A0A6A6W040_9PEZI|nr:alpha/beta-hydrolase [Pseudovirgaria hyperparasitica]KAF2755875.1 alpha/beta-hydrolase [Pseudovirgaria hyperparasitica]
MTVNAIPTKPLAPRQQVGVYPAPGSNNYACRATHANPVVFLHGLGATKDEDLNVLQTHMQQRGFCTYALTYGDYPAFPFVGGLQPIAQSSQEIAAFIRTVAQKTGAAKVDIVGHSEGAFQALYTAKFGGLAGLVGSVVALAPPTHGTDFGNLYDLAYVGGKLTRELVGTILKTVGCAACDDLGPDGAAIARLNDGTPIAQDGVEYTIIISTKDGLVTPYNTSRVDEPGVNNVVVQDFCPDDPVGHIGMAYDTWIWSVVINALEPSVPRTACTKGMPYRR